MVSRLSAYVCLLVFTATASASAADYYISASGNDAAAGSSAATAWRSLARVNAVALRAGDRVLLDGAAVLTGTLAFDAADGGTAAAPISVTSYGTGRATINAGAGSGISVYNTAGISISN